MWERRSRRDGASIEMPQSTSIRPEGGAPTPSKQPKRNCFHPAVAAQCMASPELSAKTSAHTSQ